jgi:hypothetical protein
MTSSNQINTGTETGTVNCSNDRLGAFFDGCECILKVLNMCTVLVGGTSRIAFSKTLELSFGY